VFVLTFLAIVISLVRRRGRIIRQYLLDEVALGTIDQVELDMTCSAFGLFRARMRYGKLGAEMVRAIARLSLSKWHSARAVTNKSHTISMDFIVPLRAEIRNLRDSLRQQHTARR